MGKLKQAIEKELKAKSVVAVNKMVNAIADRVDVAMGEYYDEYDPILYEATGLMRRSLTTTDAKSSGDTTSGDVHIKNSKYKGKPWTVYESVEASDAHSHGWFTAPFNTSVWADPMEELKLNEDVLWEAVLYDAGIIDI